MVRSPLIMVALAGVITAAAVTPSGVATASPPPAVAVAPGPGAAPLTSGWRIQSSAVAGSSGADISRPDYPATGWLPISQPQTLMAGLVENGRYPDVFYSDRLKSVPADQFAVNWWYRDQLTVHPRPGGRTYLIMNGVLGTADLWVNGTKIADGPSCRAPTPRFEYDITPYVHDGANAIALDVSKNDPKTYLSDSQLDWNPHAPGPEHGAAGSPRSSPRPARSSLRNVHVVQRNARDLSSSDLTVKADLRNDTASAQKASFRATITHGATRIEVTASAEVPAGATRTVAVSPADDRALHLDHPAIWWPYQLGGQPLYHLAAKVEAGGGVSDRHAEDFGIRTVTSSLTPVVAGKTHAPLGLPAVRRQRRAAGRSAAAAGRRTCSCGTHRATSPTSSRT